MTRREVILSVVDAALAGGVCVVAYRLRFEAVSVPPDRHRLYVVATVAVCLAWPVATRWSGLHQRVAVRPGTSNLERSFRAGVTTGALLLTGAALTGGALSRAWIGLVCFGLVLAGLLARGLIRRLRRLVVPLGWGLERYALVGDGPAARRLLADLTRAPGTPYHVVATLDPTWRAAALADRARALDVDGLVVPDGQLPRTTTAELATALSGTGIDVLLAPGAAGLELRGASVALLHGVPLLRAAGQAPRRSACRRPPTGTARRRGVAILGTRGIPAAYGGFETFAEHLATSFVDAGVPVTVYCRTHYATAGSSWRGVRLVTLPTLRRKHLDTIVHTLLSAVHLVLRTSVREVVLCNAANAPVAALLRVFRRRVVLNVDGLEWRRGKWGVAGRAWYRMGEWLSVRTASVLVTDAAEVQSYYRVRHGTDSVMIPYGAAELARGGVPVPEGLGVRPDGYVLYVSRWEPENNPVLVARAHALSGIDLPLVMLGAATYDESIAEQVRAVAAPHAVLPGALYGEPYRGLQANAACYIHATEVGGTHPALIEALAAGNLCLVMDTPENREVAGVHGRFFGDVAGLVEGLRWATSISGPERDRRRSAAQAYARSRFAWGVVCAQYHSLVGAAEVDGTADPPSVLRPSGR